MAVAGGRQLFFIGVYDIADRLPPLDVLADTLRKLHTLGGQPLEQSLRGGTQTDGNLFMNVDPVIVALREAVRVQPLPSMSRSSPPPTPPIRSWVQHAHPSGFRAPGRFGCRARASTRTTFILRAGSAPLSTSCFRPASERRTRVFSRSAKRKRQTSRSTWRPSGPSSPCPAGWCCSRHTCGTAPGRSEKANA